MKNKKIPLEVSVRLRYLHQDKGIKICELVKRKEFCAYSKSNVYVHAKKQIHDVKEDKRKENRGRPKLITERDERNIIRCIDTLRQQEGSFSTRRLRVEAGVDKTISDTTVRRCLNRNGYNYLQARRKGLVSKKDLAKRLAFARKMVKYPTDFWTHGVSFYLDGSSFTHKTNPCDQAKSRRSMVWRKKCEGLNPLCTAKGKKAGTGGRMAHYVVCISYLKGVILCEQYTESFTGKYFADKIIRKHFDEAFGKSINPQGRLFVQDGDPRQNSKAAKDAMEEVNAEMFAIPARSPDCNPIENFFNLVSEKLHGDALAKNIRKENFEEFSLRVKETMTNWPAESIDKIIDSMNGRMPQLVKCRGQRLKY